MKSLLKCMVLALIAGLVFYGFDAAAQSSGTGTSQIWTNAFNTMVRVFKNVRTIVYVVGAFGLIGIAIGGIVGKINFKWLGYLAGGLAIVAVADLIIRWVTTDATSSSTNQNADITITDWTSN